MLSLRFMLLNFLSKKQIKAQYAMYNQSQNNLVVLIRNSSVYYVTIFDKNNILLPF